MILVKYFFIFLIIFSCAACERFSNQVRNQTPLGETYYVKKYNFSNDWFTNNIPSWEKKLCQFKGRPNIHYLEIGVYEGRSVIWMLENILTHNTSRATCIDIFPGNLKDRFLANLKISGFKDKVKTIKEKSQIELKRLPPNSFDIIYIDGSHTADDVLADAVLSWPLLKKDGLLIFDDYLWEQDLPIELRPQIAIDAFITAYRNHIEVFYYDYQVILKKRELSSSYLFPIGQYVYEWKGKLYRLENMEQIELSDSERVLIKRLIKSRKFGKTDFSPDKELLENEEFITLIKRLKLDF